MCLDWKPVPILNDLPWGVLEPVSLDDACPKLSSVPPVSANDILGTRDPESLARAHALSLESSREAWKPPPERNKTTKSHSTHVPIPSGVIHGAASLSEMCAPISHHTHIPIPTRVIHGAVRSLEMLNQPKYGKLCSTLDIPSGGHSSESPLDYSVTFHYPTTHYPSVSPHVTMVCSDATGGTIFAHPVDGNCVFHGVPVMHQRAKTAIGNPLDL